MKSSSPKIGAHCFHFLALGSAQWEAVLGLSAFCPHLHDWAAFALTHMLFYQPAITFLKGKCYIYLVLLF